MSNLTKFQKYAVGFFAAALVLFGGFKAQGYVSQHFGSGKIAEAVSVSPNASPDPKQVAYVECLQSLPQDQVNLANLLGCFKIGESAGNQKFLDCIKSAAAKPTLQEYALCYNLSVAK